MYIIFKQDQSDVFFYPSKLLVWVVNIINDFVCKAAKFVTTAACTTLTAAVLPVLDSSEVLKCNSSESESSNHAEKLGNVICKTIIPITLKNIGNEVTERFERVK